MNERISCFFSLIQFVLYVSDGPIGVPSKVAPLAVCTLGYRREKGVSPLEACVVLGVVASEVFAVGVLLGWGGWG